MAKITEQNPKKTVGISFKKARQIEPCLTIRYPLSKASPKDKGGKEKVLKMSQINYIKELQLNHATPKEIAKITGLDVKTVKKYLAMDDFSPQPPLPVVKPSKLDPYKSKIDEWIQKDKDVWTKQKHTAKRIFDRLCEETDYPGSYNLVQRYIRSERNQRLTRATQELVWHPGEAQVDFGEADFILNGQKSRHKYLVVSFPHSNHGFVQVFGGETAECVCQGLKDIFMQLRAVPNRLVFDNATGIGRRVGEEIRETELFQRFRNHYRFPVRFTNPYSGHEKGHVERKVGYLRANLFVPVPEIDDLISYNRTLLNAQQKKSVQIHYKKQEIIEKLFDEDLQAMRPLPEKGFDVVRYQWLKADGYGKICLEGKHYYSTRPEFSRQVVLIGIRAHFIDVFHNDGQLLTRHPRSYSEGRSDLSDHSTALATLMRNVGAWPNSGLREILPERVRSALDEDDRTELKEHLRLLQNLAQDFGFENAVAAMDEAFKRGRTNSSDTAILAARIAGYGLETPPEHGPNLSIYDETFLSSNEVGKA